MKYALEEYVVAFIDILGSSKKIQSDCENSLNIVHTVYDRALEDCDKLYDKGTISQLRPIVKIYSDNIVIAVPTKQYGPIPAFTSIVILCGLIQHEFLGEKYLVRGGIVMGDFFADQTMLWGNALLDAYYIENNVSIYPRIVIHPETVVKLQLAINQSELNWIKQDIDGLFFIDYMRPAAFNTLDYYLSLLLDRIGECEELFLEVVGDIKSEQKIQWHNTYLFSKLEQYAPDKIAAMKEELENSK